MNELSVVLVSGGLDSLVTAAIAASKGPVAFMHLSYGQRTEAKELECFHAVRDHYSPVKTLELNTPVFKMIGSSSLVDTGMAIPAGEPGPGVPSTYVPFRNGLLLSMACSWAETVGAKHVYIGAVEEDSSGYPDCTREFLASFQKAVTLGTRPETALTLEAPLISMNKAAIIKKGLDLNTPFEKSWSCYKESVIACGECESCAIRLRGFQEAGAVDPVPYAGKEQAP